MKPCDTQMDLITTYGYTQFYMPFCLCACRTLYSCSMNLISHIDLSMYSSYRAGLYNNIPYKTKHSRPIISSISLITETLSAISNRLYSTRMTSVKSLRSPHSESWGKFSCHIWFYEKSTRIHYTICKIVNFTLHECDWMLRAHLSWKCMGRQKKLAHFLNLYWNVKIYTHKL